MLNQNTYIQNLMKQQIYSRFQDSPHLGLKINLYTDYEVYALAQAVDEYHQNNKNLNVPIESIMVGDSYFTTHLGRTTTQLSTNADKTEGLAIISSLVTQVRSAIDSCFKFKRPYLIGDLPDGSIDSLESAYQSTNRLVNAGADVVKIEVSNQKSLFITKALCDSGYNIIAHIGYTPQSSQLKRHGNTLNEAFSMLKLVRELKSYGVCALVLEMVDNAINQCLCLHPNDIQIYSIFSGQAAYGGQSLNVWDSFFIPQHSKKYFPPTGKYNRSEYPHAYTKDAIAKTLHQLITMAINSDFPLTARSRLSHQEREFLNNINPWSNDFENHTADLNYFHSAGA